MLAVRRSWHRWDDWGSQHLDFRLFGARFGQLYPSCVLCACMRTLFGRYLTWIIKYFLHILLLAARWRLHALPTHPRERGLPCIRVYEIKATHEHMFIWAPSVDM